MSEVARATVYLPNPGRPQSPRRNLPDGRRSSTRLSSLSEGSLESSSPSSPPSAARLTRKRAASLNTESANQALVDLSLASATTPRTLSIDPTREQVCLCQPDPKIPRPRNAFILYRQHYQAQVVQQHPGLANPEISKIIGEQWRDQSPETKAEWKRLAEEEKSRHQRQYPDYRYQPRRAGKTPANRPAPNSSTDDICPKCHGRYISTPSTPITPFTPSFNFRSDRVLPSFPTGTSQERQRNPLVPGMSNNRTTTPNQLSHPSRRPFPPQSGNLQLGPAREYHDEDTHMLNNSPDFKRRRMNEDARLRNNYAPSPTGYGPPQQRMVGRPPMSALPPGYQNDPRDRRDSFQNPPLSASFRSPYQQHPAGMMEPPPRPITNDQYPRGPPTGRAQTFDESLRLPPLQTHVNGPDRRQSLITSQPQTRDRETQAKSVEAMVMTIPFMNKIRVLTKISPPLAAPGPMSPAPETRGAIIAVEGPDSELVATVGNFLKNHLEKESEFLIKTWQHAPTPPTPTTPHAILASQNENSKEKQQDGDSEMPDVVHRGSTVNPSDVALAATRTSTSRTPSITLPSNLQIQKPDAPFLHYLDTIRTWHQNSQEIVKFITTNPTTSSSQSQSQTQTSTPPDAQTDDKSNSNQNQKQENRTLKPVALLPHGFSLSTSDYYARTIPINDAYAPVDHWQWMATLWRGIIGPDLTIYVDSPFPPGNLGALENSAGGLGHQAPNSNQQGVGAGMPGASGMVGRGVDGVDVMREIGAVVVRCEGPNGVDDRMLRRLGFEVLEIVRAERGVSRGST